MMSIFWICFFDILFCYIPVIEWSTRRDDGGVWAGVWWCDDVSPMPDAESPPYNALKSSGVLLHFRWPPPFLLSPLPTTDDRWWWWSWADNPNKRFSCDEMPINRLSWSDINFESCPPCWRLPCDKACSSNKPCCSPNNPPTKLGRRSSISFPWPQDPEAEKFNWRLKMAGKILNCWESGLDELMHRFWPPPPIEFPMLPPLLLPPPPPPPPPPTPRQLFLKSNLVPKSCCFWDSVKLLSNDDVRSVGRYSLKLSTAPQAMRAHYGPGGKPM